VTESAYWWWLHNAAQARDRFDGVNKFCKKKCSMFFF